MRRFAVMLALPACLGVQASAAHPAVGHLRPAAPAVRHLPADFPVRADHEWTDWAVGGIGGCPGFGSCQSAAARSEHWPVVFVHGNNTDAATWYAVLYQLVAERGYSPGDLWALSYNGVGCTNDGALFTRNPGPYAQDRAASTGCVVTANEQNVADLADFLDDVLSYTGASRLHVVAHSLGVTLARRTLQVRPDLVQRVGGFVAIAGANHGTSFCPPGSEGLVESCDEIAQGTPWLERLNGPYGIYEGAPPIRWMTVYDGTGVGDPAFATPRYAASPRLARAEANCAYPYFYHNDLRVDPRIVRQYADFLAAVEAGRPFSCPPPPPPGPA